MPHGRHGWLPDKQPHLDRHVGMLLGAAPPPKPTDLRDTRAFADPYDQIRNDCTANGTSRMLQVLHTPVGATTPGPMFSRDFLYFMGGLVDGISREDSGRYPSSVIDAASNYGCPAEEVWPYGDNWNKHPGGEAFRMGYDFKLGKYRIPSGAGFQDGAMRALEAGKSVGIGSGVSQAWEDQSGITPFDGDPNEPDVGGHYYVGIASRPEGFVIINSWGKSWASNGYGFLSWAWCAAKIEDALVLTLEATS